MAKDWAKTDTRSRRRGSGCSNDARQTANLRSVVSRARHFPHALAGVEKTANAPKQEWCVVPRMNAGVRRREFQSSPELRRGARSEKQVEDAHIRVSRRGARTLDFRGPGDPIDLKFLTVKQGASDITAPLAWHVTRKSRIFRGSDRPPRSITHRPPREWGSHKRRASRNCLPMTSAIGRPMQKIKMIVPMNAGANWNGPRPIWLSGTTIRFIASQTTTP